MVTAEWHIFLLSSVHRLGTLRILFFFFVSEFFIGSQIDWSTLRLPPGLVIMVVQFHFRPLRWSFALIIFCESILPHALFYYDELHLRFALQSFLTFHFNQSEFALIVSSFVDMCGLMIAMAVCCINLCGALMNPEQDTNLQNFLICALTAMGQVYRCDSHYCTIS